MAEATTTTPPKVKMSKPAASPFEMPKFEMPKFEIPKVEMPAAFREFAERGVAQDCVQRLANRLPIRRRENRMEREGARNRLMPRHEELIIEYEPATKGVEEREDTR